MVSKPQNFSLHHDTRRSRDKRGTPINIATLNTNISTSSSLLATANFVSNISYLLLCHKRCSLVNNHNQSNNNNNNRNEKKLIVHNVYLPKSISFRCCHLPISQYSCRTIAAKIKFDIKPIRLIYRPPDMRCSKWECYWYYFNINFVKLSFQHTCNVYYT